MKIAFCASHPKWGGLANNGGSRTIIKSAQTLNSLGHKTRIVTKSDRFTYFTHDKPVPKIPKKTDVCIAVSILDANYMIKRPPLGCKPFVWIRGWETWRAPEEKNIRILNDFNYLGGRILVNSEWLKRKLLKHKIESQILYPGYDKELSGYTHEGPNRKMVGTLYHKMGAKGYKFWLKVRDKLGREYRFVEEIGRKALDDHRQMLRYLACDTWFSAVSLEGLHNCALEASLCGCAVVHNDCPSNGIWDYSGPDCAEIYEKGNVEDAVAKIRNYDYNKVEAMQQKIKSKIGTREQNMIKLLEVVSG